MPGNRADIDIVFGDPSNWVLNQFRSMLMRAGFGKIRTFTKFEEVRDSVHDTLPDLLIIDEEIDPGAKTSALVRAVRHAQLGANPFLPVIYTAQDPPQEVVRRAIDAGTDSFLVKPFSPKQLLDRIALVTMKRRGFIVTSDYIGPDRRQDSSRGSSVPLLDVPNSLRAKEMGEKVTPKAFLQQVQSVSSELQKQRVQRNAFQLSFLVQLILPDYSNGTVGEDTYQHLQRLLTVANDTCKRLPDTPFAALGELAQAMVLVARGILSAPQAPAQKDLDLLEPLSTAIAKSAHPDRQAQALASDIADAIQTFKAKSGEA